MLHESIIPVASASLHVTQSDGSGPPILFIHGTGSSSLAFDRQLESPMAEAHRLIAVDLPGHGRSADAVIPALDYSIPALTRTVAGLIEHLRLDHLIIAGWSLGGHIGIELLDHPAVAGLMLSGTPPIARGPLAMLLAYQPRWDLLLASKEVYTQRDIARFVSLCFPFGTTPDLLEAVRRADGRARPALFRSMTHGEMSDQRRAVEESSKPVAVVHGRHDPFVRLAYLESLHGLWRGGPKIIEGAGHAVFWDQPAIYNTLLMNFAADALAARRQVSRLRVAG